ncbi:MAG: hypothetical protein IPK82_29975 [Polyangiaceae bacterium]|nr:hypothetical protein [Polyangiaceae bacterium]
MGNLDSVELTFTEAQPAQDTGTGSTLTTEGALAKKAAPITAATAITREQRRSRRKREVRARTISVKRMTKRELEIGRMLYPENDYQKPRARSECIEGLRPCPYVSCKHHLFLDVSARTGAIKLNFPDLEVWDMNESCALDVADRGGTTLEDVGAIMNLTRERIRQVEVKALAKLQALKDMMGLRDYVDEGPVGKRRLPVITENEDEDEDLEASSDDDDDDDDDFEVECESTPSDIADDDVDADLESDSDVEVESDNDNAAAPVAAAATGTYDEIADFDGAE